MKGYSFQDSLCNALMLSTFHSFELFKHHGLDGQTSGLGVVGQILFGGSAGLHADGLAFELLRALDLVFDGHHETLTVVIDHGGLA